MREKLLLGIASMMIVCMSVPAFATNGDNLIAVGPVARSMGGVGIAAPQDAISAVFANPAAMCFGPYCPSAEVNFSGTFLKPKIDAKVTAGGKSFNVESDDKVFAIPAIGISVPVSDKYPFWRFGFGAYGSTGLGVDYRDTLLDQPAFFGANTPLIAGELTQLQILKFSPAISAKPLESLSLGLGLHVDYSNLDLRNGTSGGYGLGAQVGAIYRATNDLSFGVNFVSPQKVRHENVIKNPLGQFDLDLESPLQVGVGASYAFLGGRLLLETDVKWLNWADADGYGDFDWSNQWVYAVGAQYKPMDKAALRIGYNFGKNPVEDHDGWAAAAPVKVQGITFPQYYYESFRIIGFPAIVEHHLTAGVGYEFTPKFAVNLGYMHAFRNAMSESGVDFAGNRAKLETSHSQDALDLGLTWRF